MVGNSLRSDIAPVLALGGSAAHVPYRITWEYERNVVLPEAPGRFFELKTLRELVDLVGRNGA
jgi:putative hydrolase of the HAD superfamily